MTSQKRQIFLRGGVTIKMKNCFLLLTAMLFLCDVLFNSCAGAFQGKIFMTNTGSSIGSLHDFFEKDEQEESLGSPTEMNVSKGRFSNKIEISWSSVKNANAYRLERAIVTETDEKGIPVLPKADDFMTLNATEIYYKTSYTDIILSEDETYTSQKFNNYYYYRVCALKTGLETDESDYFPNYTEKSDSSVAEGDNGSARASAIGDDVLRCYGYLFKAPSKIEADKGKSEENIEVKWSSVEGARKYKISRSETQNGFYYPIKEVFGNECSFKDEIAEKNQGDEYYYKISAINSDGNYSLDSAIAMGYTLQKGAPHAPENVHVENGLGTSVDSIVVSWDAVDVDSITADGAITYSLYRNTSTDSTYNLIKNNMSTDDTRYEDKKVSPGVYYYYYVQTVAEKGDEKIKSSFSESGKDSTYPAYGFLVTSPTSVEVDDGSTDDTVKLQWTPAMNVIHSAGDEEIEEVQYGYSIYYDEEQDGSFANKIENPSITKNNAGKWETEVQKHKFFKVVTVTPDKLESKVSATETFAPVPTAPTNITVSKTIGRESAKVLVNEYGLDFSEERWVANANGVFPVVITWDAPKDGAVGYNIFRSTSTSSNFKKINNSMITATGYVDVNTAAKPGVFYYYKVASLNALSQGTKSNDPGNDPEHKQRGYGALTLDAWYGEYNENIAKSQSKLTLMHKPNNLDKVGSETKVGDISGDVYYNAKVEGLGANIVIRYTHYTDYFINDDPTLGVKFVLNGETNTKSNMSANGNMYSTVNLYSYYLDLTGNVGSVFEKLSDDKKQQILDTRDTHYLVGMYPASVVYDNVEIKSGNAGGGYYFVKLYEIDGCKSDGFGSAKVILEGAVDYTVGNKTFKYH